MKDVYIVSGVRTPVGTFGGALAEVPPTQLAAAVTREAVRRAGVEPGSVGHVVFGNVIQTDAADPYMARVAAINGGLPESVSAVTVNRLCGSGMQAVVFAAQSIMVGDCDVAVAGGAESMSRAPLLAQSARFGRKLGDQVLVDMLNGALTDPFHNMLMGVTAENVAAKYDISREQQDATALESHRRASRAIREGYFRDQILPIEIRKRGQPVAFSEDEHVRHDAAIEDFRKLRAVFDTQGTVTAGNASGINDGAAALVLASEDAVARYGLKPMARLRAHGHAGVDPAFMGVGPVPASRQALERAGIGVGRLDAVESNEAFAAQACAVSRELGLDPEKTNPNGSGISLGHPIGASGAILLVKLVYELRRTGGRLGLATMCIGGGQGIATVVERV